MGSIAELLVWGPDADALADWAMAEIDRCEACWSRFLDDSELSALNARTGDGATAVSPLLWEALRVADIAHRETGGLFDPTVLGSLVAWGYSSSFPFSSPTGNHEVRSDPAPGFSRVELDATERTVSLPRGCGIDLGGIGKGLAADLVVEGLAARGAHSSCVSMGGDVRVAGPGPDRDDAWEIPIEDPRDERRAFTFPLIDEALAQSSTMFRRWQRGLRSAHHLIDPRTGDPSVSGIECAVVTARETWRAETLAKAALLAGAVDGIALLERAGVDGWLLDRHGVTHATTHVAGEQWPDASPIDRVPENAP